MTTGILNKLKKNLTITKLAKTLTIIAALGGLFLNFQELKLQNQNIESQSWLNRPIIVSSEFVCPEKQTFIKDNTGDYVVFTLNNLGKSPGKFSLQIYSDNIAFTTNSEQCKTFKNNCTISYILGADKSQQILFNTKLTSNSEKINFMILYSCLDEKCDYRDIKSECAYEKNETECPSYATGCYTVNENPKPYQINIVAEGRGISMNIFLLGIVLILVFYYLYKS